MTRFEELEIIEEQDQKPSMVDPRVCSDCKVEKPADAFTVNTNYRTSKRTGEVRKQVKLASVCRACLDIRTRKWQSDNREKFKAYQARYIRHKRRQLRRQSKASTIK